MQKCWLFFSESTNVCLLAAIWCRYGMNWLPMKTGGRQSWLPGKIKLLFAVRKLMTFTFRFCLHIIPLTQNYSRSHTQFYSISQANMIAFFLPVDVGGNAFEMVDTYAQVREIPCPCIEQFHKIPLSSCSLKVSC